MLLHYAHLALIAYHNLAGMYRAFGWKMENSILKLQTIALYKDKRMKNETGLTFLEVYFKKYKFDLIKLKF